MKVLVIRRPGIGHLEALFLSLPDIVVPTFGSLGLVVLVVHVPADLVSFPFDGINVVIIGRVDIHRQSLAMVLPLRPGQAVVQGTVNFVAPNTQVNRFHDVDLATGGPDAIGPIGRQHPDGRPHTLTAGDPGANFDPTVGKIELVFCAQPRRGEGHGAGGIVRVVGGIIIVQRRAAEALFFGDNMQVSIVNEGIVRAICITLLLGITAPGAIDLVGPIVGLYLSRLEFVFPEHSPSRFF